MNDHRDDDPPTDPLARALWFKARETPNAPMVGPYQAGDDCPDCGAAAALYARLDRSVRCSVCDRDISGPPARPH